MNEVAGNWSCANHREEWERERERERMKRRGNWICKEQELEGWGKHVNEETGTKFER